MEKEPEIKHNKTHHIHTHCILGEPKIGVSKRFGGIEARSYSKCITVGVFQLNPNAVKYGRHLQHEKYLS